MKESSKASTTKQGHDSTMSSLKSAVQLELQLFATVESVQPSTDPILPEKLNSCSFDTRKPKSSKISDRDSTAKGKDPKPYWSDLCTQISSRLLLPVETDCADSDLNYSSSWSNKTVEKSWFSQTLFAAEKPNSPPLLLPSLTATVAECTPGGATARKSKKIRIFPSPEQKAILKKWFGVSWFVFNTTIKYLPEPGTKANWLAIKTGILNSLPDWASSVPFQIKSIAIKDDCQALKKAKVDFNKDGQIRRCKLRSRKDTKQSVLIPKTAIKDCDIYHTLLGQSKLKEALPEVFSDGRLTLAYGEYYLIVSEKVQPRQTDNQGRVVALDPGVRRFMTLISENSYRYLGNDSNLQIQKLCLKLEKLNSEMSASPSAQKKRFKKAADRLKSLIQHMVKELHHKTAKFLVDNFDVILLPSFESSKMVSKSRRKLRSKTVRQMLTLSHYQFKKYLEWKAWESGKVALTNINEAYTSKTVSWAGEIKKVGGSRMIKDRDGRCTNRDINGARGIFLRALVDTVRFVGSRITV